MQEQKILHETLAQALGVVRTEQTMKQALHTVQSLSGNLALLGQAVLLSALERKESRGAQFRADYPETREQYRAAAIAQVAQGKIAVTWGELT